MQMMMEQPDAGMQMMMQQPDAGEMMMQEPTVVPAGNVNGTWSGEVRVEGDITIATGDTLEISGGTHVLITGNYGLSISGTLQLNGTGNMIEFASSGSWKGITVSNGGTLTGEGLTMSTARTCITGTMGSSIDLSASVLTDCGVGLSLANGGHFSRLTIIGGNTNTFTGGTLDMSDSTIDFRAGVNGPDCTDWNGGTAILDHVHFTGCHCPLHFNFTSSAITVTNSILDNGANAVMIARSNATFTNNNLETQQIEMLDIGGGINADIGGNYWGGGAPVVGTRNMAQFTNADNYSMTPIDGAGPR